MNTIKKIKYFLGTIYRGLIGMWYNTFDKEPKLYHTIEWFSVGNSVEGRQIKCYKIGTGNKRALVMAGIHGNEVGTVKLAKKLLNWFQKNRNDFQSLTLYVIPVLNMDGHELAKKNSDYFHRGRVGRFNAREVDLNRNFSTKNWKKKSTWMRGKNYTEKVEVFCGEFGGSEPEVAGLIQIIKNENINNLIALHNVGGDVIINENDKAATKWAKIYENNTKFNLRKAIHNSGSAAEWCLEKGISYMTVEGKSRWGSDWGKQNKALIQVLKFINEN